MVVFVLFIRYFPQVPFKKTEWEEGGERGRFGVPQLNFDRLSYQFSEFHAEPPGRLSVT